MKRMPPWIRASLNTDQCYGAVREILADGGLHTVCSSAKCPNRHKCWNEGTATFLILGNACTRNCTFCAVPHGKAEPPDPEEPKRLAEAARKLNLRHVVITSVTRDDLPDGGAGHFAATIRLLREVLSAASIEVLTPDFQGSTECLLTVLDARPNVFNHNLETVRRLQQDIRPQASYDCSLEVLRWTDEHYPDILTKSGLMLGLGESEEEVIETMRDLRAVGCDLLTIGQYLAPSRRHAEVKEYVTPEQFEYYERAGMEMGFKGVVSAPLARSSFKAEELLSSARSI